MRECPKCSYRAAGELDECPACGIVYSRWRERDEPLPVPPPSYSFHSGQVSDGRIGRDELTVLGIGLIAAIVVYALPFLRFVLSVLVTLFHEIGHAVAGWMLGHPSLPAFDFVYGGGFTHQGAFRPGLALLVAALLAWVGWHFRHNGRAVALITGIAVVWLVAVSAGWRRELVIAASGHLFEFILAGVLFYQALSGTGWRNPEVERPLGAFVAFFVQIHSMMFAWRLTRDADFLEWYRGGKGGALMNDLESVALDLTIHFGLQPGIEGVARMLLMFSPLPFAVAVVWHMRRSRWHAMLRSLRLARS